MIYYRTNSCTLVVQVQPTPHGVGVVPLNPNFYSHDRRVQTVQATARLLKEFVSTADDWCTMTSAVSIGHQQLQQLAVLHLHQRGITLKSSRADIVPWIVDEGRRRARRGLLVGGLESCGSVGCRTWPTDCDIMNGT